MEGNSTQMIRCIKKTDKEYPQKLLQYSSMPADFVCEWGSFPLRNVRLWQSLVPECAVLTEGSRLFAMRSF